MSILDWIEEHPVTVQALTWLTVILIGWATGVFAWIRNRTRKPRLSIQPTASRCLIEEFEELEGTKDVVRAAFLVNVSCSNPSAEKIVIEGFELSFRRKYAWRPYGPKIGSVSLPNRPRKTMGSGIKYMGVFFTNFPDDANELTVAGRLGPKDFCAGYLLFVSFTFGSWNPLIENESIKVRLYARLTTGYRIHAQGRIPITRDKDFVEEIVPGLVDQVAHETAWNVPAL